ATPVKVQIPTLQIRETESKTSQVEHGSTAEKNPNIVNSAEKQVPDKGFSDIEKEFFETEITPENDYSGIEEILSKIEEKHKKKRGLFGSIKKLLVQDTPQNSGKSSKKNKKSQTRSNKKNNKSNKKKKGNK
ncbi:MAG: hypothetical protein PF689_13980, partial [Deltaproteobacteria bacterium]|nr:hypothetical protein [Deltaproteobacteria bacterium]